MRAPGGAISIDETGRAPGRGAYLCRDGACWQAAGRKRALEHALGAALPADLAERLAGGAFVPPATSPNHPPADGERKASNPDPKTQGGARGQE